MEFSKILIFYVYNYFACMYVCVPVLCLVPIEVKRGQCVPWNCTYRQL